METLVTGILVALVNAGPILVFGVIYRLGRRLDLSLDAQLAAGGVSFGLLLGASGSFMVAGIGGVLAAAAVAGLLFLLTEWGRVPIEVGSLLTAFAVFKLLEFVVGESLSLVGVEGRLHPLLLQEWAVPTYAFSVGFLLILILVAEVWLSSHSGLMYKAQGDNKDLPLRRSAASVRGVVALFAAAFVGIAGVLATDRTGGVFSGFHLARVIDAFVVAELTMLAAARLRQKAGESWGAKRRALLALAETPISVQLVIGATVVGVISYALVRHLHPALPAMIEALVVLFIMSRFDLAKRLRSRFRAESTLRNGLSAVNISHAYRQYGRAVKVLADVTLEFAPLRGLKVVYGGNGVGKSTLLRILAGVEEPSSGTVRIDRSAPARHSRLINQDPTRSIAPTLTVRENLELALGRASARRHEHPPSLDDSGARELLMHFTDSPDLLDSLNRPAATLSGGQLQLLAVACASLDGSLVILADEPVKQLDSKHRQLVEKQLVRLSKKRLVVLTSHFPRLDLAAKEDHFLIEDGTLHSGVVRDQGGELSLKAAHG